MTAFISDVSGCVSSGSDLYNISIIGCVSSFHFHIHIEFTKIQCIENNNIVNSKQFPYKYHIPICSIHLRTLRFTKNNSISTLHLALWGIQCSRYGSNRPPFGEVIGLYCPLFLVHLLFLCLGISKYKCHVSLY